MQPGRYLSLPTTDVHMVDSGGSGRLVLLVHGLGGQHTNWLDVRDDLRRLGHVVSIDLPGFGLSPPLEDHGVAAFADVVVEAVEALGSPALLIGNSMGGLVCEMVAAERPDLVEGLVLISPATRAFSSRPASPAIAARLALHSFRVPGTIAASLYGRLSTPEEQALATLDLVSRHPERISSETRSASLEMAVIRRTMPWAIRAFVESAASIRRILLDRARFDRIISSIAAPTLLLNGAADEIVTPAAIATLARTRPDWVWFEHPEAGHVPQMEDPAWVVDHVTTWAAERLLHHPLEPAGY